MTTADRSRRWTVAAIAAALALWGVLLAVGAYLGGETGQPNLRRGLVVAAAVLSFLALWGVVLRRAKRG